MLQPRAEPLSSIAAHPLGRRRADSHPRVGRAKAALGTRGSLAWCPGDGSLRGSAYGCRAAAPSGAALARLGEEARRRPRPVLPFGATPEAEARTLGSEPAAPGHAGSVARRSLPHRFLNGRHDPVALAGAWPEDAVVVGRAVAPAMLQPVEEPAVVEPRQPLRRDGRPRHVAAQAFEPSLGGA